MARQPEYTFVPQLQSDASVALTRASAQRWIDRLAGETRGFRPDDLARFARNATVFAAYCSPAGSEARDVALVGEYLLTLAILNDSIESRDFAHRARVFRQAFVEGRMVGGDAWASASASIASRLRARGLAREPWSSLFRARLIKNLDALSCESATLRRAGIVSGWQSYLRFRANSVSVAPYLVIWQAFFGWVPSWTAADTVGLIRRVEWRSALIQGLANDLFSLPRDRSRGVANAVLLRESKLGKDSTAAWEEVMNAHDRLVARTTKDIARVLKRSASEDGGTGVPAYLAFIQSCIAGNLHAMLALSDRYVTKSSTACKT